MSAKYLWGEDTIMYFYKQKKTHTLEEIKTNISNFVFACIFLEEGETEEELVNDIYNQVLETKYYD